jgi:hypothetical protein
LQKVRSKSASVTNAFKVKTIKKGKVAPFYTVRDFSLGIMVAWSFAEDEEQAKAWSEGHITEVVFYYDL